MRCSSCADAGEMSPFQTSSKHLVKQCSSVRARVALLVTRRRIANTTKTWVSSLSTAARRAHLCLPFDVHGSRQILQRSPSSLAGGGTRKGNPISKLYRYPFVGVSVYSIGCDCTVYPWSCLHSILPAPCPVHCTVDHAIRCHPPPETSSIRNHRACNMRIVCRTTIGHRRSLTASGALDDSDALLFRFFPLEAPLLSSPVDPEFAFAPAFVQLAGGGGKLLLDTLVESESTPAAGSGAEPVLGMLGDKVGCWRKIGSRGGRAVGSFGVRRVVGPNVADNAT